MLLVSSRGGKGLVFPKVSLMATADIHLACAACYCKLRHVDS